MGSFSALELCCDGHQLRDQLLHRRPEVGTSTYFASEASIFSARITSGRSESEPVQFLVMRA
jgi:hypothetical protein